MMTPTQASTRLTEAEAAAVCQQQQQQKKRQQSNLPLSLVPPLLLLLPPPPPPPPPPPWTLSRPNHCFAFVEPVAAAAVVVAAAAAADDDRGPPGRRPPADRPTLPTRTPTCCRRRQMIRRTWKAVERERWELQRLPPRRTMTGRGRARPQSDTAFAAPPSRASWPPPSSSRPLAKPPPHLRVSSCPLPLRPRPPLRSWKR